jgi:tetratricopeptide (TPR) repeat protein
MRPLVACFACATLLFGGTYARAQDTQPEREPAAPAESDAAASESLEQLGEALLAEGNLESACPKLEQSVAAAPSGKGAFLLGHCYNAQGKVASAWAAYRQAAVFFVDEGNEPNAALSRTRAQELEPKVSKLTIAPAVEVEGMEVLRDGVSFGIGIVGVPIAIDPGKHTVEVRAPGHRSWRTEVVVRPNGDRAVVAVPPLQRLKSASDHAPSTKTVKRRGASALLPAGIVTAGAGTALLAVGGILGAVAARYVDRADADLLLCGNDNQCTPDGIALIERADDYATASTVTFVLGAVGTVTGVTLLVIEASTGGARVEASARELRFELSF